MIEIESSVAKSGKLELLIDTGATVSMLKLGSLNGLTVVDTNEKIRLGTEYTLGSTMANLRFNKNVNIDCEFQVIKENNNIPGDGILGTDFLCEKVIMDFADKKMYCHDQEKEQSTEPDQFIRLVQIERDVHVKERRNKTAGYNKENYIMEMPPRSESHVQERIPERDGLASIGLINLNKEIMQVDTVDPKIEHEELVKDKDPVYPNIEPEKLVKDKHAVESNMGHEGREVIHNIKDTPTYTNMRQFDLPLLKDCKIENMEQYKQPEKYKAEMPKQIADSLQRGQTLESVKNKPNMNPITQVAKSKELNEKICVEPVIKRHTFEAQQRELRKIHVNSMRLLYE